MAIAPPLGYALYIIVVQILLIHMKLSLLAGRGYSFNKVHLKFDRKFIFSKKSFTKNISFIIMFQYLLKECSKHIISQKNYYLQFGSIAFCIHFQYLITYIHAFSFAYNLINQREIFGFAVYNLTIMTQSYVHFLT